MGVHDEAMETLREIYELTISKGNSGCSIKLDKGLQNEERNRLIQEFKYLEGLGYIQRYAPSIGNPFSYTLTPKGIQAVENVQQPVAQPSVVFNNVIHENNGIIGNNATGNTFNISKGLSFEEIKALMQELNIPQPEQQEITKELAPLYECIDKGYPIQKGMLARAKDHLEKYQTLYAAVGQTIASYLMAAK